MSCAAQRGSYGPGVCQEQREDYMECLHRSKLVNSAKKLFNTAHQHVLWHDCIIIMDLLDLFSYSRDLRQFCSQASRLDTIAEQKKKLIREGKWPPKQ